MDILVDVPVKSEIPVDDWVLTNFQTDIFEAVVIARLTPGLSLLDRDWY